MSDTQPEQQAVARELGRLCQSVDQVGRDLGDIKTACAVLVERSDRNEQDVRQVRVDMEKGDEGIRGEVHTLRLKGLLIPAAVAGFSETSFGPHEVI